LTHYEQILVEIVLFKRGGSVWATISGEGGRPPTNFGVRKLESLGYHVVLFAFSRFDTIPACDTQTDTHSYTDKRWWLLPAHR